MSDRQGHRGQGGYSRNNDRQQGGNHDRRGYGGHQRSFVGVKRGHEDRVLEDPRKALVSQLLNLGDQADASSSEAVAAQVMQLKAARDMCARVIRTAEGAEDLVSIFLDCVTQLSTKTHLFAALAGLLNTEQPGWVTSLLAAATTALNTALASPQPAEHDAARLLLRWLASLPPVSLLHASDVAGLLQALVQRALDVSKQGVDPSGHSWQPWSDWLVGSVLAALPWAGAELSVACPAEWAALSGLVEAYLAARPIQFSEELRPFTAATREGDMAAQSDSGGASHLPMLWAALQQCQAAGWKVAAIPSLTQDPSLASCLANGAAQTLPAVQVPEGPALPAGTPREANLVERAAVVRLAYPVRGGIRLLDPSLTDGDRLAVERFVAEEYITDTLAAFEVDRVRCVRLLSSGLPLPWPHSLLLAETLFSQLLAAPQPRLPAMAYCTVMVDLCKVPYLEFARALSGCVRECYARVGVMDMELRRRLLHWLAYHLSNYQFQWPWDKWEKCVDAAEHDPQRAFCSELISRLTRLAHWERIATALTPKFRRLLGPPLSVPLLPSSAPGGATAPHARPTPRLATSSTPPSNAPVASTTPNELLASSGYAGVADPDMVDTAMDPRPAAKAAPDAAAASTAATGDGEGGEAAAGQPDVMEAEGAAAAAGGPLESHGEANGVGAGAGGSPGAGQAANGTPAAPSDVSGGGAGKDACSGKAAEEQQRLQMEQHQQVDELAGELLQLVRDKVSGEAVFDWMRERDVEVALGQGPQGPLKVLMRALLSAGSKSPSHLHVALGRYDTCLTLLAARCDPDANSHPPSSPSPSSPPRCPPGELVLLQEAAAFYSCLPQKVLMVVDRLLAVGAVSEPSAVHWALGCVLPDALRQHVAAAVAAGGQAGGSSVGGEEGRGAGVGAGQAGCVLGTHSSSTAWEVLHYALQRVTSRSREAAEAMSKEAEEEGAVRAKAFALTQAAAGHATQLTAHIRQLRAELQPRAAARPPPPPQHAQPQPQPPPQAGPDAPVPSALPAGGEQAVGASASAGGAGADDSASAATGAAGAADAMEVEGQVAAGKPGQSAASGTVADEPPAAAAAQPQGQSQAEPQDRQGEVVGTAQGEAQGAAGGSEVAGSGGASKVGAQEQQEQEEAVDLESVTDQRGRRLLAAHRDALYRAGLLQAQADKLRERLDAAATSLRKSGAAPGAALLVAYHDLTSLLRLAEQLRSDTKKAAAGLQNVPPAQSVTEDVQDPQPADAEASQRAAKLREAEAAASQLCEEQYAQLRAFARQYAAGTGAVLPQLVAQLAQDQAPQRMMEALAVVLHGDMRLQSSSMQQ
ncbi:hypothetical protein QJQ45_022282 [Haematococcus lacustris]|nr:hypothetical protein QJQ45_022282 [Haematococcus lacustris]